MNGRTWIGKLNINWRTLTIHQQGMLYPFNDWTDEHIRQGFTWRPGSVSFQTLVPSRYLPTVLVETNEHFALSSTALRIIKIPFDVGAEGVEVTSPVSDSWAIALPAGHYAVFFSIEPDEGAEQGEMIGEDENAAPEAAWLYHITFIPAIEPVQPEILRADSQLDPPEKLLMEAEPA